MVSSQQLQSSQILNDCQRSLDLLETVPDGDKQLFRIYWTFCLVALRNVEDALVKYDAKNYPEIKDRLKKRHGQLSDLEKSYNKETPFSECSLDYLIYHRLIHGERNVAVHEVKQTYSNPWTFLGPDGSFDLGDTYLPMGDLDLWGDWDCRDWLKEGIAWWRKEINDLCEITNQASKGTRK